MPITDFAYLPTISPYKFRAMSTLEAPVVYRPLRPGCIRLLELWPGRDDDLLSCRIRTYPRSSSPPYEALSYMWGPQDFFYDLYCGERPTRVLKISGNLRDALLRLRPKPDATQIPRLLWIDKICINQDDVNERNSQVRKMGLVYRNARKVLVWLGEEDQATEKAFHFARSIHQNRISWKYGDSPSTLKILADCLKPYPMLNSDVVAVVSDVHQLTRKPWFIRAWVFQEIILPTDVDVICGGQSMSLKCLEWFCGNDFHECSRTFVSQEAQLMIATRKFLSSCTDRRLPFDDLERLFNFRRETITNEPHDIIFSLLGLFPESLTTIIRPDYLVSIKDTFAAAARLIISESSNLRILCAVECPKYDDKDGFPSWVPDWRAPKESCKNILRDRNPGSGWCATQDSPLLIGIPSNKDELEVWGVLQATVTAIDEPNDGYHALSRHRLSEIYRPTNQPITAALRHAKTLDVMEFYGDTMIGSQSRGLLARFLDLPEAANRNRQDICNTCEIKHAMPSLTPNLCDEDEALLLRPAFQAMQETTDSRVFIVTDSGHIGFAPTSTKAGDQVYLLLGLHVPVVLRPHGQKFKFIGSCYIHGIMYGEGLHHNCFVNSQCYPGSNPVDEVWFLQKGYEHVQPHRHWGRPKGAARGEKAKGSKYTGWELYSTPRTQFMYPDSSATETLWLIGDGPDPLPVIARKIVLV